MTYREFMDLSERQYWNALSASGMSMSRMAQHAGLNRPSLYKRLRRIGLDVKDLPGRGRGWNRGNAAWQRLTAESRISTI